MKYYLRSDIYFDSKAFSLCDLHYEKHLVKRMMNLLPVKSQSA